MKFLISKKVIAAIVCSLICFTLTWGTEFPGAKDLKSYLSDLPFAMPSISEPVFPDYQVNIKEFGAIADGKTLNTKAFADAISACAKAGGGTVVVSPGTWLTGPIGLMSNVNLNLERGALVQFSKRYEDFPIIAGLGGNSKKYEITPPIFGYRLKNVAITGEGIFDGAGEVWRPVKKEKQTASQWKELVASGGVVTDDGKMWWPSKQAMEGEKYLKDLGKSNKSITAEDIAQAREYLRPDLFKLIQCDGILLDGPTFRNSPKYHLHPTQCENIIIRNVTVSTAWFAQNGDGIDLSSCRNVLIYKTTVDAGDDGICVKPAKISSNQNPGPACENIVIADCTVYHGHGGFVIGSESLGGAHNISVKNCTFIGTDVGLRFKSNRGRGGLVDNVFVDGVQMRAIDNEAILFDMYYGEGNPEELVTTGLDSKTVEAVTALTPRFQNISIKNVVCNGARRAILINGLPEMPIRNIWIDSMQISAQKGVLCVDADSISLSNIDITSKFGPVISTNQSRNIFLSGIKYLPNAETFLIVKGNKTENIRLKEIDLSIAKKDIEIGKSVKPGAVVLK
jgi:DNA sulfur modification protein DndE